MKKAFLGIDEYYVKLGMLLFGTLFYIYRMMSVCDVVLNIVLIIGAIAFCYIFLCSENNFTNKFIIICIIIAGGVSTIRSNSVVVTLIILLSIAIEVVVLQYCGESKTIKQLKGELNTLAMMFVLIAVVVAVASLATYFLGISYQYQEPNVLGDTILHLGIDSADNALIGVYSNANSASVLYVSAFGMIIYLGQKNKHRILLDICLAVLLVTLYLTGSRGAILGVGVIILFFIYKRIVSRFIVNNKKKAMVLYVVLVLFCGFIALLQGVGLSVITSGNGIVDSSTSARISLWKAGIRIVTADPLSFLFGVGGNFREIVARYVDPIIPKVLHGNMHNIYMQVFVTFGILGLLFFAVLLFRMIFLNLKNITESYDKNKDLIPLIGVVVAIAVISIVEADFYMGKTFQCTLPWILSGYVFQISQLRKKEII